MDLQYDCVTISGFEMYIIEQWIATRKMSALLVSYTGNTQDTVKAVRVNLPKNPLLWPGKFRQYYEELCLYAQPRMVKYGTIFVSTLSSISPSLNLLHVECGDLRRVWGNFEVNFDMKKLHCGGRSALLLSPPSNASKNKFSQLFKIPMAIVDADVDYRAKSGQTSFRGEVSDHLAMLSNVVTGNSNGSSGNPSIGDVFKDYNEEMYRKTGSSVNGMGSSNVTQMMGYSDNSDQTGDSGFADRNRYRTPGTANYCPIVELVTLTQISLGYFNLLPHSFTKDGLFCDGTKIAIQEWWDQYGRLYLGTEKPKNENTLGPTTVAALISLVLSCFFKLMLEDCMPAKDPFDEDEFYQGIALFQRKHGLLSHSSEHSPQVIHLDHQTLNKLTQVTAKISSNDFLKFRKAVKCRMQDMVGRGNPLHLANGILTDDLDTLVKNIHCNSLSLLWEGKGKPRKGYKRLVHDSFMNFPFSKGNPEEQLKTQKQKIEELKRKGMDKVDPPSTNLLKSNSRPPDDKPKFTNDPECFNHLNDEEEKSYNEDGIVEGQREESEDGYPFQRGYSSNSISSMYCNYDRNKFKFNSGLNRGYQAAYYRRNSIPQVDEDVLDTSNDEIDLNKTLELHRSNSMSLIQDTVESWALPFDPSVVRFARDLRRIENTVQKNRREEVIKNGYHYSIEHAQCSTADTKFNDLFKTLQRSYQGYAQGAREFQTTYTNVDHNQQVLLNEMHELNSLASKLKYDVRVLEFRMRDVEESLEQFDSRLHSVKETLMVQQNNGIREAVKSIGDKKKFDMCVTNIMRLERNTYEAFCLKLLGKNFLGDIKQEVSIWGKWIIEGIFFKNGLRNSEKDMNS